MKRFRIYNDRRENIGRIAAAVLLGIAMLTAGMFGLSACEQGAEINTDTPENKGTELSFRVSGSRPETYAIPQTVSNLEAFCVNAILDSGSVSQAVPNPLLLRHQTVAREFNTNTFAYQPRVYLPVGFKNLIITAFAPIHLITDAGQFELATPYLSGHNTLSYKTPDPDNGGHQEDLIVAYTKLTSTDIAPTSAAVALNFKHALSLVHVSVKNHTNTTLIIKELKLKNVLVKGVLDLDANIWDGPAPDKVDILDDYYTSPASNSEYKCLWDLNFNPSTHEYGALTWDLAISGIGYVQNAAADVTTDEQGMLVIPHVLLSDADADGPCELQIMYRLNNLIETQALDLQKLIPAFEMGKQYKIELTFDRASVGFDVGVEEWPVEEDMTPEGF